MLFFFYANQSRTIHDEMKRLQKVLQISDSKQWEVENSGLPAVGNPSANTLYFSLL
jgi:hypothetical protein